VLGVLAATAGLINMTPVATALGLEEIELLHDWLAHGEFSALTSAHYGEVLHDIAGYSTGTLVGGEVGTTLLSGAVSLGLALTGAGLARALYDVPEPVAHTERLGEIGTVLYNNYYQDEYQVWLASDVVRPLAALADRFDRAGIDGTVDAVSDVSLFSGRRLRRLQTGVVSNYAALLTLGLTALLVALGLMGGWF
jgi:NADH-quinone oxidoreductase subunit L